MLLLLDWGKRTRGDQEALLSPFVWPEQPPGGTGNEVKEFVEPPAVLWIMALLAENKTDTLNSS